MAGGPGSERDKLTHLFVTLGKVLGVVVTLVTLVGGAVTVLFQLDPTLEPCIGGAGTQFTSVQVIPNYPLSQYLLDELGYVPSQPAPVVGAEVRYTYTADNLSGNQIVLYGTLEHGQLGSGRGSCPAAHVPDEPPRAAPDRHPEQVLGAVERALLDGPPTEPAPAPVPHPARALSRAPRGIQRPRRRW
jgi:hypothetical protein